MGVIQVLRGITNCAIEGKHLVHRGITSVKEGLFSISL